MTDGIHYTVAVNAGTGDGTIGLALTGDGVTDLAGNPLGKVYSEATAGSATGSASVLLADVNGDGKKDLVVLQGATAIVRLGNGDGTFGAPVDTTLSGATSGTPVVADFFGTGADDIAAVSNGTVLILSGHATGILSETQLPSVYSFHSSAHGTDTSETDKLYMESRSATSMEMANPTLRCKAPYFHLLRPHRMEYPVVLRPLNSAAALMRSQTLERLFL